jgi:hypothetical protein
MKKKYFNLLGLVRAINESIGESKTIGQKKLGKIGELLKPYIDEYNDKRDWIFLSNAMVDDDKCIILDEKGGYKFTAESTLKRDKELLELFNLEFDYKPIQINNPNDLEQYWFLNDWVIGMEFPDMPKEEEEDIEL